MRNGCEVWNGRGGKCGKVRDYGKGNLDERDTGRDAWMSGRDIGG